MMMSVMGHVHSETDDPNGEGEGVWSPEIEQAFQKALEMFPPCGRRKHILQEEGGGKMYGRNELIARYIEQTTGHRRTRKQVSSHIQVLSRREARNKASSRGGDTDSVSPASSMTASSIGGGTERVLSRPDSATSGSGYLGNSNTMITPMDIVASNGFNSHYQHPHHHLNHQPHQNQHTNNNNHHLATQTTTQHSVSHHHRLNTNGQILMSRLDGGAAAVASALNPYDSWEDRPIMTRKIRLVEFSAFVEQRKQTTTTTTAAMNGNSSNSSRSTAALTQAAMLASLADGGGHLPPASHPPTTALDTTATAQVQSTTNPHLSAQLAAAAAYTQQQQQQQQQQQASFYAGNNSYTNGRTSELPSGGLHRHSYVKIDYRQLSERQALSKMERIDIHEIQDKFPDIVGPEGLYARGSPDSFFLVKFWADLDHDADQLGLFEDQNSYFGFSSHFETPIPFKDLTCSTKACSYGKQVVEKVEKVYGTFNSLNNTYSYEINKSPMCEFMIQFIRKLRQLPELALMNRILENFTALQLVTSESTSEILMCIAYVFEIAPPRHTIPGGGPGGSHYHVYKLTKD